MKLEIYCDGSGNTMQGTGGYGWVIVRDGVEMASGSGFIPKATNNVAEITAAIKGMEHTLSLPEFGQATEVSLVSDSQLVLRYATGEYKCKAMHLVPLYIRLRSLYGQTRATTRWVRGHTGDHFNEKCDTLAGNARKSGCQIKNELENISDSTDLKTELKDLPKRKSGARKIQSVKKKD